MSGIGLLPSSQDTYMAPPSSPLAAASVNGSTKPRKPPSITPRRFTRFFTPATTRSGNHSKSRSSRRLKDITKTTVNQPDFNGFQDIVLLETPHKRRKILPTPESSPVQPLDSSPLRPLDYTRPSHINFHAPSCTTDSDVDVDEEDEEEEEEEIHYPAPVTRLRDYGSSNRLLTRSFGGGRAIGRGRINDHCSGWQTQTSRFYSRPEDCHTFRGSALPFCVTRCNNNSLVAVGDEEGGVRLIDSAYADKSFAQHHVHFKAHHNAVMDLAFSSDDYLFATASGDQTARVIDMRTQQTRFVMQAHTSSVKQVRFQPANDNIVATSSRDGSVMIWDLRCRGQNAPVADFGVSFQPGNHMAPSHSSITYASSVNSMRDAHGVTKADASRRSDVSITALSFLPDSRSNLLLTSSEANSSVKLWDLRANYTSRRDGLAIPVSSTRVPEAHKIRPYGISSLALNGDGSRFYALCRDSTVYAYSTNHLIMGHAPELDLPTTSQASNRFRPRQGQTGLGPLYGFRHHMLHAGSFYVRAALRPATSSGPEMLAVGSRDGCAVLFPTDEALLRRPSNRPTALAHDSNVEDEHDSEPPRRRSQPSVSVKDQHSTLPIYTQGTALVRAHGTSEVTGLTWTSDGELVTLGDDFSARCWREKDPNAARDMRLCGEGQGARHEWGWAEVDGCDDEEG